MNLCPGDEMRNDRLERLPRLLLRPVLAGAIGLLVPAGCGDGDGVGPEDVVLSEPFDYQEDATDRTRFQVNGVNGNITVTGVTSGNTLLATGVRRVRNCSRSRAEQWLAELEVQVGTTTDEIVVQTVQPEDTSPCTLEVEYELTVPARLFGRVVNVNGNVTATTLSGGTSVTDVNGNIVLAGVVGSTTVRLTNGNITADVEITGAEAVDLLTVNGNVALTIPHETSATLAATLANGLISVVNLVLTNQVSTGKTLTGVLGAGAGSIVLGTVNGNITLSGT